MTFQNNPPIGLGVDAAARTQGENLFDLTDLLRMIQIRKQIIIGTAATVITLTIIYLYQVTPLYTAQAVVMLDQRENKVLDVSAIIPGLPTDPQTIQNQVQILRSRTLISRVVDRMHLDQDGEFGEAPGKPKHTFLHYFNPLAWFTSDAPAKSAAQIKEDQRNGEIDGLLSSEKINVQGDSTAIGIQFQSADAEKAAKIANAIAEAYVDDQLNAKFEATQKTSQWLADRLQQLSSQVQAAEAAVQQYKADANINETSAGTSVIQEQLGQLNGQLILARSTLAEQEARYGQVLALKRSGHSGDVSQVVASPLITQLRGQETELMRQEAELNAKYGARHPKMLDLEAEKKNLESKIDDEVARVIETVASDVAVARAHVSSLQGSLAQLEGQTSTQARASVKLKQLESTANSTRALYEAFLSKFKEAQGQQGIETPDARVISHAEVPGGPSFPNKQYTLGIAVPAGIFLGLLLALVAERLDAGFRTNSQIEKLVGLPVLATLPEMPGLKGAECAADAMIDKPLSSYTEAVRGLQIGLAHSNVDQKAKTVLVTSSVPNEGKTTVALSLARLAARSGQRVVLVDADLRHPSVAPTLGVSKPEKGILEVLVGDAPVEECLIKDPKSTVSALLATKSPGNPPDLLGSGAMHKLIDGLRKTFDMVIIDSAPLLPVHDARVLAHLADAVVFVVRWDKTPREAVVGSVRALADSQARVAGIALTRADPSRYKYYAYGYQDYSAYHKYYND